MSTSEKRKGMQTDMPELQAMISQRIQEQNYREVLKGVTAFPWCTDDPCVFRTAAGNLWIAVGHVNRKSEVPKFSYKNFLCAYLLGNAEDGVAAYLDLQAAAWKGVELVMFSSHADGLSALYGDGERMTGICCTVSLDETTFLLSASGKRKRRSRHRLVIRYLLPPWMRLDSGKLIRTANWRSSIR